MAQYGPVTYGDNTDDQKNKATKISIIVKFVSVDNNF